MQIGRSAAFTQAIRWIGLFSPEHVQNQSKIVPAEVPPALVAEENRSELRFLGGFPGRTGPNLRRYRFFGWHWQSAAAGRRPSIPRRSCFRLALWNWRAPAGE